MKFIAIELMLIALLISGCASKVGWGKKYEIVQKNSKSITVRYDSILADFKNFGPVVDAHCQQYGKEAVPAGKIDSQANSAFGGIQTVTFRCE